jgi:demethylmenaquinone methyltransferase/2-methoxy-6-polyprenyl-1,4-benzoquinol methylase
VTESDREDLLREQTLYYRARAPEYDEWCLRRGRYDRGPELARTWAAEVAEVARALADFHPSGRVLELAGGTGWWTERLAPHAESLTVVDVSPEMLALNRERVRDAKVRRVEADLFDWQAAERFDVVFFSFWLSHVPPERFDAFWQRVQASLAPEGRVFFIDSLYEEASTATDHHLEGPDAVTALRRLNDGREFRIIKVFYRPDDLAARLASLGWRIAVRATANHFLYGYTEQGGAWR